MDARSPPEEKVTLFRSLFRGREDVFPLRFENARTGRAGYSPACANEWVRPLCQKPRVKCSVCPNQSWLPVTDEVVCRHLSGEIVMGVYPLLPDETCLFLAADFDGPGWMDDARIFQEVGRQQGIPMALERSRSGEGCHAWIFFEEAIPAALARRLGALLLTGALDRRPGIGLGSYDRFFPNQDTLPRGGFGNLIALPLQKSARERGNTLFLNENFSPHSDQWAFLAALQKVSSHCAEELVAKTERRGNVLGVRMVPDDEDLPWRTPPSRRREEPPLPRPLPASLEAVLADQIYFSKESVPAPLRNRLIRLAAFQNPEFYRAQALRMPVFGKPRIISCAEDHPAHFSLPRGCLEEVRTLLNRLGIALDLRDERHSGLPLEVTFRGSLRPGQQAAAEAMLAQDCGVLAATTAFGKTVLAAWLIAQRGVNTLILVHRRQLLEQWVERLSGFLGLPRKSIGRLGGGRKKLTGLLDVALVQSLIRRGRVDDQIANYGHIVVDECHHIPAKSFEEAARRAKARFVTGLSATVTRKDGHHPIIFMQCGPIRHRVDAGAQAVTRPFIHRVFVRPTGFRDVGESEADPRLEFQRLVAGLVADATRNRRICEDVIATFLDGRAPLVLTERTEHLQILAEGISQDVPSVIMLRGGMSRRAMEGELARLGEDRRVVLATGRFAGEGFDDPRLDTLFLALPVSWRGTITQYAGRLHRLHEGKREVRIYDYADLDIPMLARMFDRRCAGYEALGYDILLPASAVPGWPVGVPLPVDPRWKETHSASVQRLIRDGVSAPLAGLFLRAAMPFTPDAQGAARARSASEAFLFHRLETLPMTRGRFQLNAPLPIPFDNTGRMEVDFLCAEARLVLELDGSQHLGDAEAYRRDRRKDALLQRHGYMVLRFLAEDASRHLDAILDAILAALAHGRHEQTSENVNDA